jgi:hypothetical protein
MQIIEDYRQALEAATFNGPPAEVDIFWQNTLTNMLIDDFGMQRYQNFINEQITNIDSTIDDLYHLMAGIIRITSIYIASPATYDIGAFNNSIRQLLNIIWVDDQAEEFYFVDTLCLINDFLDLLAEKEDKSPVINNIYDNIENQIFEIIETDDEMEEEFEEDDAPLMTPTTRPSTPT